jgi:hypothetical protein
MKVSNYIYTCRNGYIVKFNDDRAKVSEKVFCNKSNLKEALKRAERWRDKNLPSFRKKGRIRLCLKKILKNKVRKDLPAGISYYINKKKMKNGKVIKYYCFSITAGHDKKGHLIIRRIYIHKFKNEDIALSNAIRIRKQLLKQYHKTQIRI